MASSTGWIKIDDSVVELGDIRFNRYLRFGTETKVDFVVIDTGKGLWIDRGLSPIVLKTIENGRNPYDFHAAKEKGTDYLMFELKKFDWKHWLK